MKNVLGCFFCLLITLGCAYAQEDRGGSFLQIETSIRSSFGNTPAVFTGGVRGERMTVEHQMSGSDVVYYKRTKGQYIGPNLMLVPKKGFYANDNKEMQLYRDGKIFYFKVVLESKELAVLAVSEPGPYDYLLPVAEGEMLELNWAERLGKNGKEEPFKDISVDPSELIKLLEKKKVPCVDTLGTKRMDFPGKVGGVHSLIPLVLKCKE